MKQSNILDPIHDTLDPNVWDDPGADAPKLKPQLRKWIISRITEIIRESEFGDPTAWLSLVLTGSLTTYQFSPESDCDVSLFVDPQILPDWDRAKMIALMIDQLDEVKLPGTTHPMQGFVVPPLIKREDLYQPGLRSGYDLLKDEWIIPPERNRVHDVEREYNSYYVYALESADKMERLLKYDPQKAVQYWHQIHRRRRADQQRGKGDYSESNIVYKFLANRGLFPAIEEASGEHIAGKEKILNKLVQKFVYDPTQRKLLVGPLAPIEGVASTHNQLAQQLGVAPGTSLVQGYVNQPGYASFYSLGNPGYKAQWEAEQALKKAIPHVQFSNPQDDLWNDESLWDELQTQQNTL